MKSQEAELDHLRQFYSDHSGVPKSDIDRLEAKLDRILAILAQPTSDGVHSMTITPDPRLNCQCDGFSSSHRLIGDFCSKCGKVIGQG